MNPYVQIDPWLLLRAAADDLESFRALSETYLLIAPPMLERLRAARLAGDLAALAHESHALKGSAALLGATGLCALLQQLESAARAGQAPADAGLWQQLEGRFEAVAAEVALSIAQFDGTPS